VSIQSNSVSTLNNVSAAASVPQQYFLVTGIQDPIAQQNFERLNKIISQIVQGTLVPNANLVIGPQVPNSSLVSVTFATYTFTVTSCTCITGDTYTNNGFTFTIVTGGTSVTTITATGTGTPKASGTLVKASIDAGSTFPIVFSAVTSPTSYPGSMQAQIRTFGNPVRVKLAPFQISNIQSSSLSLWGVSGHLGISATFGWQRTGSSGVPVVIAQSSFTGSVVSYTIPVNLPLPFLEFDDVVPAGSYTYQFFFTLLNYTMILKYQNLNVVAYELR